MKLQIHYLTDDRRHYTFPHFIRMLNESQRKHEWSILVLTHTNDEQFYIDELNKVNVNSTIIKVPPHNNYLVKVHTAIDHAINRDIPYMMKCDNDIFLKAQTLDYMIDQLDNVLNNPDTKHLTLGPVLSTGIPGVEYFCEEFLDPDAQATIKQMFLNTTFSNDFAFGANYNSLNKHTIHSNEWNKTEYFNTVRELVHHYKGVHPIRVNNDSIRFLNDYIIQHKDRFMENRVDDLNVITDDSSPYLCNSIFCIKTDTYKTIVNDSSLFVDDFEEVPLNKYAWQQGMNHAFVKNGFAIHMYYNWMNSHMEHEHDFCNKVFG